MAGQGLSVSDVVQVTVTLEPLAAGFRNFGSLLILGSSNVIDVNERIRQYSSFEEVQADFGDTDPEYLAAELFFDQSPQPNFVYIGRWAQSATAGLLHGGLLSASQQLLTNFTVVTNGAMLIFIDSVPYALQGVSFASALNLNGVASDLQTALDALDSGVTVVWNSEFKRFDITSGTTGTTSSVSFAAPPTAIGHAAFSGQPSANDTISFDGTTVTFVASGATGNEVNIGTSLAVTLQSLLTFLNASTDTNISTMDYFVVGSTLYCVAKTAGAGGNALTLVKSSTAITLSGATLSGGSGTDISALLALTAATFALPPVVGLATETLQQAVNVLADMSSAWYGLTVASNPMPQVSDYLAVAVDIEAMQVSHIFGITSQDSTILASDVDTDIASQLQSLDLERTFTQYSSSSLYAAASIFGRAFTVNFDGSNTTLTLKFKQEPGVVYETLTESQAAAAKAKNCNIFVLYQNGNAIIQEGVMANGFFFDEVHGTDWLQNRIQTDLWNVLYQSPTKIPQTDQGTHVLVNTIANAMVQSVVNGLVAPGVWNAPGFGQLAQGDTLPLGYYIYAPPVATQAQADREARKSVPIQVAAKLAGAIHFAYVAVSVNR